MYMFTTVQENTTKHLYFYKRLNKYIIRKIAFRAGTVRDNWSETDPLSVATVDVERIPSCPYTHRSLTTTVTTIHNTRLTFDTDGSVCTEGRRPSCGAAILLEYQFEIDTVRISKEEEMHMLWKIRRSFFSTDHESFGTCAMILH